MLPTANSHRQTRLSSTLEFSHIAVGRCKLHGYKAPLCPVVAIAINRTADELEAWDRQSNRRTDGQSNEQMGGSQDFCMLP